MLVYPGSAILGPGSMPNFRRDLWPVPLAGCDAHPVIILPPLIAFSVIGRYFFC